MTTKITESEERLADYAQQLAEWFKYRELPQAFTGKLVLEPLWVKGLVSRIQEEYSHLEQLTNEEY